MGRWRRVAMKLSSISSLDSQYRWPSNSLWPMNKARFFFHFSSLQRYARIESSVSSRMWILSSLYEYVALWLGYPDSLLAITPDRRAFTSLFKFLNIGFFPLRASRYSQPLLSPNTESKPDQHKPATNQASVAMTAYPSWRMLERPTFQKTRRAIAKMKKEGYTIMEKLPLLLRIEVHWPEETTLHFYFLAISGT